MSWYSIWSSKATFWMHFVVSCILNCAPSPRTLLTVTLPPICSIIYLHIDRPSPVPPLLCSWFSDSFPKFMKRCFNPSSEIPSPVSIMLRSRAINFSTVLSISNFNFYVDLIFLFFNLLRISSVLCFGLRPKVLNFLYLSFFTNYSSLILIITVIFPFLGVNFKELEMKLMRIYLIRLLSP